MKPKKASAQLLPLIIFGIIFAIIGIIVLIATSASGSTAYPIILFIIIGLVFAVVGILNTAKTKRYNKEATEIVARGTSTNAQFMGAVNKLTVNRVRFHSVTFKYFDGEKEITISTPSIYRDHEAESLRNLNYFEIKHLDGKAVITDERVSNSILPFATSYAPINYGQNGAPRNGYGPVPYPTQDGGYPYPPQNGYGPTPYNGQNGYPQTNDEPNDNELTDDLFGGAPQEQPENNPYAVAGAEAFAPPRQEEPRYYNAPAAANTNAQPSGSLPHAVGIDPSRVESSLRGCTSARDLDNVWFQFRNLLDSEAYFRLRELYDDLRGRLG
ncbi:MAG: hypothetical protein LBT55_07165 [Clostridiaceae bacterium]|jgi:hypothetical protein|nr:hypothetical protein [Clostridiaceae bacterium]